MPIGPGEIAVIMFVVALVLIFGSGVPDGLKPGGKKKEQG